MRTFFRLVFAFLLIAAVGCGDDDPMMGTGGTGGAGGIGGYVPGACYQGDCIPDPCWDNPCYDGNDCTWDECLLPDGSCSYTNVPDGYYCMGGLGECLAGECELYALCGGERSIPPTATTSSGILLCNVQGILEIFIEVTLAATPSSPVQQGPIDVDMQFEFALPPETVNDLLNLGASPFEVESLGASVNATMGDSSPMPVWVYESPVPCVGILEWDTRHSVVTPETSATWTLDDGSILELTAEHFEEIVDDGYVVLATEDPPASCAWETPAPSVSFEAQP